MTFQTKLLLVQNHRELESIKEMNLLELMTEPDI